MRRPALATAFALALASTATLAACGKSDCQELGERICRCQPGLDSGSCETQVKNLLQDSGPGEGACRGLLESCNAPSGAELCEWMLTETGRRACGLSPAPSP